MRCSNFMEDSLLTLLLILSLLLLAASGENEAKIRCAECRTLKENNIIMTSQSECFTYKPARESTLKSVWSTSLVKINGTDVFKVLKMLQRDSCSNLEMFQDIIKCFLHQTWQSQPEFFTTYSNTFRQDEDICLKVMPDEEYMTYSVSVKDIWPDPKLVSFTLGGLFLFFYARTLSRSATLYYAGGVILGVFATSVFLLLAMKRVLPGGTIFFLLMLVGLSTSGYMLHYVIENLSELLSEYKTYTVYYLLGAGFVSFAVCYKLGPLTNEWVLTLLTWLLQLTSFLLLYWGLAVPEVAYAMITVLICSKGLCYPFSALCYLGRKIRSCFRGQPVPRRLLTEEEYREQAEVETYKALEELRRFCRSPEFPAWLTVSKLHAPKRFANFLLGDPHVLQSEVHMHEENYGLGGSFLEDQLFQTEARSQPNQSPGLQTSITEDGPQLQGSPENIMDYSQWQLALIN